ncbi:unnamed protein product [Allacma fusca]|uniref:Uncharacterized protein n=1 Tax=Allacma fusca TaxID=39272 RepID=A0A8J2PGB9_9HEXA|nr:unnamed protein product [Allacma fusca]
MGVAVTIIYNIPPTSVSRETSVVYPAVTRTFWVQKPIASLNYLAGAKFDSNNGIRSPSKYGRNQKYNSRFLSLTLLSLEKSVYTGNPAGVVFMNYDCRTESLTKPSRRLRLQ